MQLLLISLITLVFFFFCNYKSKHLPWKLLTKLWMSWTYNSLLCISDSNASYRSSNIQPPGVSFAPCLLTQTQTRHHMSLGPWVSSLLNPCQIFSEHLLKSVCLFNIIISIFTFDKGHMWRIRWVNPSLFEVADGKRSPSMFVHTC